MFILQIMLRRENRVRTMVLLLRYESSFFNMIVCHKFEATSLERSANIVVVGFVYTGPFYVLLVTYHFVYQFYSRMIVLVQSLFHTT